MRVRHIPNAYTLRALNDVDHRAFDAVESALHRTFRALSLPGHLFVTIVPGDCLRTGDGDDDIGFAMYQQGTRQIAIAGLKPELSIEEMISDDEWLEQLRISTAHEVVHYKQELDGTLEGSDANEQEAERLAYEVLGIEFPKA